MVGLDVMETLALTGTRSPDRPVRSESPNQLRCFTVEVRV